MLSLLTLLQLVIFIRSPDLVLSRRIQDSLQSAPERLLQGNACDTNAKRDCRNECFEDKKCVTDVCKVVSTNDGTANDTDSVDDTVLFVEIYLSYSFLVILVNPSF